MEANVNDLEDVKPGRYVTRDGSDAFVYERGKNMLNADCWIGVLIGGGITCWSDTGKEMSGYTGWDLVRVYESSNC